jgi:hypothetical protein
VLTLKLKNVTTEHVRIVECGVLDIFPSGEDTKIKVMTKNEILEFLVSDAPDSEFNIAFVENARGSTTQVVRPRGRS